MFDQQGNLLVGCQRMRGQCPQVLCKDLGSLATEDYRNLSWECLKDLMEVCGAPVFQERVLQ